MLKIRDFYYSLNRIIYFIHSETFNKKMDSHSIMIVHMTKFLHFLVNLNACIEMKYSHQSVFFIPLSIINRILVNFK